MQKTNLDGIKKIKSFRQTEKKAAVRAKVFVDGVRVCSPKVSSVKIKSDAPTVSLNAIGQPVVMSGKAGFFRRNSYKTFKLTVAVVAFVLTFGAGMLTVLETRKSEAEVADPPPSVSKGPIFLNTGLAIDSEQDVSGDLLFNTPLDMLQDYFTARAEDRAFEKRKADLKSYLTAKNSPFAAEAETIAEQEHWKLILAISFAESTLGKKCYYNNCSGIGGSNIKTYKTVKNWILDFNRLLEKRYKDQTLEQMCGVYVKPCNPNWLLATKQVLQELNELQIK